MKVGESQGNQKLFRVGWRQRELEQDRERESEPGDHSLGDI